MGSGDESGVVQRRRFLASMGALGGAVGVAGAIPLVAASPAAAQMKMEMPRAAPMAAHETEAPGHQQAVWLWANADEAAFLEAAVDTLIPHDDVGPGALELGVATFIDRQMAGGYGRGARLYMQGPFAEGLPQQGWQLPMTPAEALRAGIEETDAWCKKTRKSALSDLAPAERAAALADIDAGHAEFGAIPAKQFFELLLGLTMEGYFADPAYGGNRNKGSWKMIGFPGVAGMYANDIETYRNKPYPVAPRGLADS